MMKEFKYTNGNRPEESGRTKQPQRHSCVPNISVKFSIQDIHVLYVLISFNFIVLLIGTDAYPLII